MQEEMLAAGIGQKLKRLSKTAAEIASPYASKDELRPSLKQQCTRSSHRVVIHVHSIKPPLPGNSSVPDQLKERLAGLYGDGFRMQRPHAARPGNRKGSGQCTGDRRAHTWKSRAGRLRTGLPDSEKLLCEVERRLDYSAAIPKAHTTVCDDWRCRDGNFPTSFVHALGRMLFPEDSKRRRSLPMPGHFSGPDYASIAACGVISKSTERLTAMTELRHL